MLNFDLMTDKDRREAASIQKRRAFEEERKKRIFNPRARLIGVDVQILERQIEERKKREFDQQRVDRIFDEELKKADQIATDLERKEKAERQRLQREINNFRKNYQKPEDRREFDLNDPDIFKKQLPMRIHDDDPRLGISSAQKFEGEDLVHEQRSKLQREEFRAWLDQHQREKELAEKERKTADDAYKAAVIARDQRAIELDNMEKVCRRKLQEACQRFNKALADEKDCIKQKEERQEKEDNMAEVYNFLTSDLLTENPEVANSNMGAGRKIGFLYKGMTEEEKKIFRVAQMAQIEEDKKRKEFEARRDREMDDYIDGTQKTIYLMDRELELKERERRKQLAEENKQLAEEQNNYKKYVEKIVHSNAPTEEYFNQFNKSTR